MQALERWAADNGVNGDFDSICQNPKAKEYILGELTKIGKEKKVCYSMVFWYFISNFMKYEFTTIKVITFFKLIRVDNIGHDTGKIIKIR